MTRTSKPSAHVSPPSRLVRNDGSTKSRNAHGVRRYTLSLYPDGQALEVLCDGAATNPVRKDNKPDLEWTDRVHALYAQFEEKVALEFLDAGLDGRAYSIEVTSIDEHGASHPWQRELDRAIAPPILDPGTADHTVEYLLLAEVDLGGGIVVTTKCPVKIVFGPRLGD